MFIQPRVSTKVTCGAVSVVALLFLTSRPQGASEGYLSGTITAAPGTNLEGVTVSAQIDGEPITTSVYTAADGRYFFPAMKPASYHIWAQVSGYERADATIALGPQAKHLDFKLKADADPENLIVQLSGYQVLAALPEDTVPHRRGKAIFQKSCLYCHEASTALRDRFDEHGWEVVIGAMLNGFSKNPPPPTALQRELASYLAEMRGPGRSPMSLKPFRVAGEATLPVVYEYDVRYPEGGYTAHNGSDWRYGSGSSAGGGGGLHDAVLDFDGNIWFTSTVNGKIRTIGKIDTKTGETFDFALPLGNGTIARSHGMYLASDGLVYFNAGPQGRGAPTSNSILGRVDPTTGQLEGFRPTGQMLASGWLGGDAKGYIWTAGGYRTPPTGALRFDPRTKTFVDFFSGPSSSTTYGITGDREGDAWWCGVQDDVIEHFDSKTSKVVEIPLPAQPLTEYLKPGDITEAIPQPGVGGKQSPRRPRADLNGSDVWVPNWFGNTVVRIDARTSKLKYYAMPYPGMSPYEASIDGHHRLWVSLQGSDEVARLDPDTDKWTFYSWPSRGTAQRQNNVLDRNGVLQVVLTSSASHRVGRMVMRTAEDMQALRARAN